MVSPTLDLYNIKTIYGNINAASQFYWKVISKMASCCLSTDSVLTENLSCVCIENTVQVRCKLGCNIIL